MNIIISGAGGVLGQAILRELKGNPDKKIIAVTSSPNKLSKAHSDVVIVENKEFFDKKYVFSPEDIFINCAFPRNANGTGFSEGLQFVKEILEKVKGCGCRRVINISSQSIYGENRNYTADENSPVLLETTYAVGKYAQELLVETNFGDAVYTNIRLASLLSPDLPQRVVNKMINAAIEKKKISVLDNQRVFGFLDVDDAAKAVNLLIDIPSELWSNVYNLGSGKNYTLLEIAQQIKYVLKTDLEMEIKIVSNKDTAEICSAIDSQKLVEVIGEYRQNSLLDTIRKILNHSVKNNRDLR